jgi:hypothetical protein
MRIKNTIKIFTIIAVFVVGFKGLTAQSTLNNMEISYSNYFDSKYIS